MEHCASSNDNMKVWQRNKNIVSSIYVQVS